MYVIASLVASRVGACRVVCDATVAQRKRSGGGGSRTAGPLGGAAGCPAGASAGGPAGAGGPRARLLDLEHEQGRSTPGATTRPHVRTHTRSYTPALGDRNNIVSFISPKALVSILA